MMKKTLALLTSVAAIAMATPASAATFLFTATGGVTGSGTITATQQTATQYLITAISGTIGGGTIGALTNYLGNDNLLFYPTTPYLNVNGVSFGTSNAGNVNLYYNTGLASYRYLPAVGISQSFNLAITPAATGAVPEPATWAMMMLGFGGMGYAMRRKAKVNTRIRFA